MIFDSESRRAAREVDIEIDHVAAELIRQGVSPWEATVQAREIVRRRRAREVK